MPIGRVDFEVGHIGRVHQAVLDAIPEEEAIGYAELRVVYGKIIGEDKPPFEQVMDNLSHLISGRPIGAQMFYIRRKAWLSSAEVARRLDVSMRTVQAWGQKGKLGARRVGDRLRFAAEAVEDWVRGRHYAPGADKAGDAVLTNVWDNEKDAGYERL